MEVWIGAAVVGVVLAGWLAARRRPARAAPRPDNLLGRALGRYRLVQKLGSGSMGTVYRAMPPQGLPVAIKVVNPALASSDVFRGRFEREARVCSELDHPALVRVTDYGEDGGLLYLVMELVPGETLRQRMVAGMSVEDAVAVLRRLMEGMAFAHKRGVIHRDLKPGNVMVTPAGGARILDFGLVRGADFNTLTKTGQVLGTVGYGAPEQLSGRTGDERSDQYALGVIGYEMLTGRQPFRGNLRGLVEGSGSPEPPSSARAEVPAKLSDVVMRMMARDPNHRFEDLESALEALERAVS